MIYTVSIRPRDGRAEWVREVDAPTGREALDRAWYETGMSLNERPAFYVKCRDDVPRFYCTATITRAVCPKCGSPRFGHAKLIVKPRRGGLYTCGECRDWIRAMATSQVEHLTFCGALRNGTRCSRHSVHDLGANGFNRDAERSLREVIGR